MFFSRNILSNANYASRNTKRKRVLTFLSLFASVETIKGRLEFAKAKLVWNTFSRANDSIPSILLIPSLYYVNLRE